MTLPNSTQTIWRKRAARFSRRGLRGLGRGLAQAEWQAAADLWKVVAGDIKGWVVDLGAGNGGFWDLVQRPSRLISLDLVIIPQVTIPPPMLVQAKAEQLPFTKETITGLTALGLVEYLHNLPMVFQEWRRVVKPNGYLLLTNSPPVLPNMARRIFGFGAKPRPDSVIITDLERSGWKVAQSSPRRGWQSAFLARPV